MRTFFSGCLLMIILCSKSQPFNHSISAKSLGMGDATVAFCDHWSIFNNVGGISRSRSAVSLFSVHNRFNISELSSLSAGLVFPVGNLNFGLTINNFGDRFYQQNQLGLAAGHTVGNTSLGLKINYLVSSIEGYGSRGFPIVEMGSVTELSTQVRVGMYVYNLNLAKFGDISDNRLPVIFRVGISYHPISSFILNAELEKTLGYAVGTKIGILYRIREKFYVSSGVQTDPLNYNFGVGTSIERFETGYALSGHSQLGLSHLLSISYELWPEK